MICYSARKGKFDYSHYSVYNNKNNNSNNNNNNNNNKNKDNNNKGCRKGTRGTDDLLYIDQDIMKARTTKRKR